MSTEGRAFAEVYNLEQMLQYRMTPELSAKRLGQQTFQKFFVSFSVPFFLYGKILHCSIKAHNDFITVEDVLLNDI